MGAVSRQVRAVLLAAVLSVWAGVALGQNQVATAPGLSPAANLSDLPSTPTARSTTIPVTQRAPTGNDATGYVVGSIWIGPNDQVYQLDSLLNGKARWIPYPSPGKDPAALVSGAPTCLSTRRVVPTWTSNLFTVTRATDLATLTIGTMPDGSPNVSALSQFLASSVGIGYVTTLFDQSGGGNNATQAALASMPQIDMSTVQGSNVPLTFDTTKRQYYGGSVTFANTWVSGTTVTFTALPVPAYVLPGGNITGTNIPASTTIVSVNYATGAVVLSGTGPTGTPGALTYGAPPVWLDIPNTATVPWQSWSTVMAIQSTASGQLAKPFIWGVHGADASAPAGSWAGVQTNGSPIGLRMINGNSASNSNGTGPRFYAAPQVFAVSMGGTGGRDLRYLINGVPGFASQYVGTNVANTLAGGAIGTNNQFQSGTGALGDFLLYDFIGYPTTLAASDMATVSASIDLARGWKPQASRPFVVDGSSTTAGNGTVGTLAWPFQTANLLRDVSPMAAYQVATGGTLEQQIGSFSVIGPGAADVTRRDLLVVHPGLGNSMQTNASITVTGQAGNVLTVAATANTVFAGIGTQVTAPANLPAGASVIAFTPTTITLDPAHAPTGTVASLTAIPDTAAQFWASQVLYCQTAVAAGYPKIVLIGSAGRGTFSAPQLVEFNTEKTFDRENWRSLPGVVGYIDLEDDPYFGDDGGTMVVTGISGSGVTVNALSTYAATNNRVRWSGMPFNLAADTGGQTITAVAGLVLTVSGATSGLAIGQTIRAVNPAPWTTYPLIWPTDHQHFRDYGYKVQGATIAQYLLAGGLLQ
jgi:hypothetical protein